MRMGMTMRIGVKHRQRPGKRDKARARVRARVRARASLYPLPPLLLLVCCCTCFTFHLCFIHAGGDEQTEQTEPATGAEEKDVVIGMHFYNVLISLHCYFKCMHIMSHHVNVISHGCHIMLYNCSE